jgi:hypothetical protein
VRRRSGRRADRGGREPYYATGNQTAGTVTVRAHEGGGGGEYRLEVLVGQD